MHDVCAWCVHDVCVCDVCVMCVCVVCAWCVCGVCMMCALTVLYVDKTYWFPCTQHVVDFFTHLFVFEGKNLLL